MTNIPAVNIIVLIRKIIMTKNYYGKDKALAEIFTHLLIFYEVFKEGEMTKVEY